MSWVLKILTISLLHVASSKKVEKTEDVSFESSVYGKDLNAVTKPVCEPYTKLKYFDHFLSKTCPTNYDPVCDDPVFDHANVFDFRCQLSINNNEVQLMNSSTFLDISKLKDSKKRNWCMITMFYAHNCQFSAQLAPSFNKLPSLYTNLLVVAIQGTEFTKLNFRYGISGTPTVLLWINGVAVSRMSTKSLNLTGLTNFIGAHTDLLPNPKPSVLEVPDFTIDIEKEKPELEQQIENEGSGKNEGVQIIMNDDRILPFLYTFLSFVVCITTFIYHIRERLLLSPPVLDWMMSRFGQALCEDIYFLLYVEPPRVREAAERQENDNGRREDEAEDEEEEEEFRINNNIENENENENERGDVQPDELPPLLID